VRKCHCHTHDQIPLEKIAAQSHGERGPGLLVFVFRRHVVIVFKRDLRCTGDAVVGIRACRCVWAGGADALGRGRLRVRQEGWRGNGRRPRAIVGHRGRGDRHWATALRFSQCEVHCGQRRPGHRLALTGRVCEGRCGVRLELFRW